MPARLTLFGALLGICAHAAAFSVAPAGVISPGRPAIVVQMLDDFDVDDEPQVCREGGKGVLYQV